jgi:protein TonB
VKGTLIGCILATLSMGACGHDSSSPTLASVRGSQLIVSAFAGGGATRPTPILDADSFRGLPPDPASRLEGTVALDVMVDATGQVTDVTVRQAADARLTEASIAAVRRWTYQPAKRDGQPISAVVTITIVFRLP